jgi:hypothetical protein
LAAFWNAIDFRCPALAAASLNDSEFTSCSAGENSDDGLEALALAGAESHAVDSQKGVPDICKSTVGGCIEGNDRKELYTDVDDLDSKYSYSA